MLYSVLCCSTMANTMHCTTSYVSDTIATLLQPTAMHSQSSIWKLLLVLLQQLLATL
jgi:hypothetical protein